MTEEQITNRYVRGWTSREEYRAEMVKFYEREDAKDRVERIAKEAYAKRGNSGKVDPIWHLVTVAVRLALADAKAEGRS
jgi:hypothetical protein